MKHSRGKPKAVIWDLDGTLSDDRARAHYVEVEQGRKRDWHSYFDAMDEDQPIAASIEILHALRHYGVLPAQSPQAIGLDPATLAALAAMWLVATVALAASGMAFFRQNVYEALRQSGNGQTSSRATHRARQVLVFLIAPGDAKAAAPVKKPAPEPAKKDAKAEKKAEPPKKEPPMAEASGGGLNAKRWSASGYGHTDPIAVNDTPEGRGKNRRVELILMPDVEEMLDLKSLL
jgi:hypothetical protein